MKLLKKIQTCGTCLPSAERQKSLSPEGKAGVLSAHTGVDVLQPWGAAGDIPGVRNGVPCVQGAPDVWFHLRTAGESRVTAPPYSASSCGPQLIFAVFLSQEYPLSSPQP